MTSAWDTILNDLRRTPRYQLRLSASVVIFEGIEEGHSPAILAYTRDISRDGVCLTMPAATVACEDFQTGGTRALRITLGLSTGASVELAGRSVYCIAYKSGDHGREYLVGVELTESERPEMYHEFIESLYLE